MFKKKEPEPRWWVVMLCDLGFDGGKSPFYQPMCNTDRPPIWARPDGSSPWKQMYHYVSGPFSKGEAIIEADRMNTMYRTPVGRSADAK